MTSGKARPQREPEDQTFEMQACVLPVVILSGEGEWLVIGSCFVIGTDGRSAVLLTAKHVMEYAGSLDGTRPRGDLRSPFFQSSSQTELKNTRIYVVVSNPHEVGGYFAEFKGGFSTTGDLMLFVAHLPDDVSPEIKFHAKVRIDCRPPNPGEEIMLVGWEAFDVVQRPGGVETGEPSAEMRTQLQFRHGRVAEVFEGGFRHDIGPSFRFEGGGISSGMSGGPAFVWRQEEFVVCGVNTLDLATEELSASGESAVVQMIWPALAIQLSIPCGPKRIADMRLVELTRLGWIEDVGAGCDHVAGIEPFGVENFSVRWSYAPIEGPHKPIQERELP